MDLELFSLEKTIGSHRFAGRGECPMKTSSYRIGLQAILTFALLGTGAPTSAEPLPEGNTGIAAQYPGDQGIGNDPSVVFTDNFEAYTGNRLTVQGSAWNNVWGDIVITQGAATAHSGSKAARVTHNASPQSIGAWRDFGTNGFQTLHVRYYMKFHPEFPGAWHSGMNLFGGAPGVNQGSSTGVRPNGANHFFVGLDALAPFLSWSLPGNRPPGFNFLYVYHMRQGGNYGDNFYPTGQVTPGGRDLFDGSFVPRPAIILQRDRWYSFEIMVRVNTPGQRNGRAAFWIDGELAGDFPGLEFRNTNSLKVNFVTLSTYSEYQHANKVLWYDDVVASRSYIGPMVSSIPPLQKPTDLRIVP